MGTFITNFKFFVDQTSKKYKKTKTKMAAKGKKSGSRKPASSTSSKCGLQFPVGRTARLTRAQKCAERQSKEAAIYMTAVLEYLGAEILELSGNAASDNKSKTIIPRHMQLAIRNDEELNY